MAKAIMTEKKRALAVAVARDVLAVIKAGETTVSTGAFAQAKDSWACDFTGDSKADAVTLRRRCRACALGQVFFSLVSMKNKFDFASSRDHILGSTFYQVNNHKLLERLKEVFTVEQMVLIENAFEKGNGYFGSDFGEYGVPGEVIYIPPKKEEEEFKKLVDRAAKFGARFWEPEERLKAIMKNIIRNNGEFVPPKVTRKSK